MRVLTLVAVVGVGVLVVSATVGTGVGALDSRTPGIDGELEAVGDALADALEPDAVNSTAVEQEIHAQVNAERRTRGLAPLTHRDQTAASAAEHAAWMADTGELEHADLSRQYRCEPVGENIAYTYASADIRTADGGTVNHYGNETEIARGIVRQWMRSEGHRENLLDPRFSGEGIGVATNDTDEGTRVYATQALCE